MDVKEVEIIMENLSWLQKQMPIAIANWQASKPNCLYHPGLIGEICQNPGKLNPTIFDPLKKWLADYILNREGKIAFTGSNGLDFFLKVGLRNIFNYVIIADFFSKNPYYFAPTPPVSNITAAKKVGDTQKQYQEFINTLSSKLIGCNEQLGFIFLQLSKTIAELPQDLMKMRSYLEDQCLSYRIRSI